jgi:hypothetical protein
MGLLKVAYDFVIFTLMQKINAVENLNFPPRWVVNKLFVFRVVCFVGIQCVTVEKLIYLIEWFYYYPTLCINIFPKEDYLF